MFFAASHSKNDNSVALPKARRRALHFALAYGLLSHVLPAMAANEPTVIVHNQDNQPQNGQQQNSQQQSSQQSTDPQVAPQPNTPFVENTGQSSPVIPNQGALNNSNPLTNPDSLASSMQPTEDELTAANQELLGRNAQLQRDVNELQTRVNVLVNEHSGQLFMYGAVTVAVSLLLGFLLGVFVFSRRDRW